MKNKIQNFLSVVLLMTAISPAIADDDLNPPGKLVRSHQNAVIDKYNAFESEALRMSFNDSFDGFAEGKVCDLCEEIKVTITPETKAYKNNIEVPLKNAKSRIGRFATVTFDVKSKQAVAIYW
ncbi:hypothetical protein MNBD_GAMMA05-1956 [hydrothermal vent metagenome]|uniref:Uncharacterized protein n=1 Tax=hydrothermal vent metagenome TaxID=652676 RepID=A0A3B0X8E3_9ZZZZ